MVFLRHIKTLLILLLFLFIDSFIDFFGLDKLWPFSILSSPLIIRSPLNSGLLSGKINFNTQFHKSDERSQYFTKETLKGGVVTPEEIVDAYINSNRALYEINRRMYLDIDAAKVLGMSEDAIGNNFDTRGERRNFNVLNENRFRPYVPSLDVRRLFEERAFDLGVANPYEQAIDVIDRIRDVLESVPMNADLFPDLQSP